MSYRLRYFASLADEVGMPEETVSSQAHTPQALFAEIKARHSISMPRERLRVAVNGEFVDWQHMLDDGDEIVFVPPVSGG